jgi:hypothetical protein
MNDTPPVMPIFPAFGITGSNAALFPGPPVLAESPQYALRSARRLIPRVGAVQYAYNSADLPVMDGPEEAEERSGPASIPPHEIIPRREGQQPWEEGGAC